MSPRITDRTTAEVVVLVTVLTLALVVLFVGAGLFAVLLWTPDRDPTALVNAYGNLLTTVLGGFLGYAAGRGQAARRD